MGFDIEPLQPRRLQGLCSALGFNLNYLPDLACRFPRPLCVLQSSSVSRIAVSGPFQQGPFLQGQHSVWSSSLGPCLLAALDLG